MYIFPSGKLSEFQGRPSLLFHNLNFSIFGNVNSDTTSLNEFIKIETL